MKKKTALITGSTGKLASEIAKALAAEGYLVILNYRSNKKAVQKLSREIGAKKIIQADVTNPTDVKKLFKQAGPVDILINGVGDFIYKPLEKTSEAEFTECVENNLMSAWYCTKAALPLMRKRKSGHIINFGSAGCDQLTARPFTTPYYIAKTGLLMLTRSLAREEYGRGIHINMISPGVLPHGIRPEGAPVIEYSDIVNGVLFLLSSTAKKITGANLTISAGWKPE